MTSRFADGTARPLIANWISASVSSIVGSSGIANRGERRCRGNVSAVSVLGSQASSMQNGPIVARTRADITAAVMSALVRATIGPFCIEEACDPSTLTAETLPRHLLSPRLAIPELPTIELTEAEIQLAINGLAVPSANLEVIGASSDQEFAGVDSDGNLVSILRRRADGALTPFLNFRKAG